MKSYSEFIDITLSDFNNDTDVAEELAKFKADRKNEMRNRELKLRERGLSDDAVINDLIISENVDARHDFIKHLRKSMEEKVEKQRMLIKFLMAVAYFMVVGILFFLDSFYNHDWGHSWLIIVTGILIFAIMLFLMPSKFHYHAKRFFSKTASASISCVLAAVIAFLFMIVYHVPKSYVIFPAVLGLICLSIALVPVVNRERYAIIHFLVSFPLFATFLYVTLGLLSVVPWATGWLLIIASLVVDIIVFILAYTNGTKIMRGADEIV